MKIVFDNIVFSIQKNGGISVVWQSLLQAIQTDLSFSSQYIEYPGGVDNMCRRQLNLSSIECRKPRMGIRVESYLSPNMKKTEPFIFHSSYYRVCNNPNAINITTVHDFTYEHYRKGLPKIVHSWQKFKAIRKSQVVVCISENTKQDLLRFLPDVNPDKIRVIYNGVSDSYYPLDESVKQSCYHELGSFLLFVSGRQEYKRFDLVVEAARLVGMKLVIVGSPLNAIEEQYLNKELGTDGYVAFSHIKDEELNKLYNTAYCLVYPSMYEGFGIPVIEAQRAGCPVIAFNNSSIPEVIGDTPLLINNLSVGEIIQRLKMIEVESTRKAIIENGIVNAKRFSWDNMTNSYKELYKEVYAKLSN